MALERSGKGAFMLTVVSESLETYSKLALETLTALPGLKDTQTSFSLKEVKQSTQLPLKPLMSKRG